MKRAIVDDIRVRLDFPPQKCACGYEFECCSPVPVRGTPSKAVPEQGSITVCLQCARVYVFDADLCVQPTTLAALPIDVRKDVRRVVDAIHKLRGIPS